MPTEKFQLLNSCMQQSDAMLDKLGTLKDLMFNIEAQLLNLDMAQDDIVQL
jgi:hypothetical protein